MADEPISPENDPGFREAMAAVDAVNTLPKEARRTYLEALGAVSVHYMRAMLGDNYTRGWLDHALSDLDRPPLIELRKPQ